MYVTEVQEYVYIDQKNKSKIFEIIIGLWKTLYNYRQDKWYNLLLISIRYSTKAIQDIFMNFFFR